MSNRKLLVIAVLATILGSTAACADVTGPTQSSQSSQFCQVTNGGGTCTN